MLYQLPAVYTQKSHAIRSAKSAKKISKGYLSHASIIHMRLQHHALHSNFWETDPRNAKKQQSQLMTLRHLESDYVKIP